MTQKTTFEAELERRGTIVFTNVGASMMPLLRQGRDLMVIQKKGPGRCKKYDAVLYKRPTDGRYILHRILKVKEDGYIIAGDNNSFLDPGITDQHILGVLTAVVRDGKQISVTDPQYLRYVHLWCDLWPLRIALFRIRDYWRRAPAILSCTLKKLSPSLHRWLKKLLRCNSRMN